MAAAAGMLAVQRTMPLADEERSSCNAAIYSCARKRDAAGAVLAFKRMIGAGLVPDEVSYGTVVQAWALVGDVVRAEGWLREMRAAGFEASRATYAMVVRGLERRGASEAAAELRERMRELDALEAQAAGPSAGAFAEALSSPELWRPSPGEDREDPRKAREEAEARRALKSESFGDSICRYADRGDPVRAAQWLEKMVEAGFAVSNAAYAAVVNSFLRQGKTAEAVFWMQRASAAGLPLGPKTFHAVLEAQAAAGNTTGAVEVLDVMHRSHFPPDAKAYSAVVRSCSTSNASAFQAGLWLQEMSSHQIGREDTYDLVMRCFAETGDTQLMARWLDKMEEAGIPLNADAFLEIALPCVSKCSPSEVEPWLQRSSEFGGEVRDALRSVVVARVAEDWSAQDVALWLHRMLDKGLVPEQAIFTAAAQKLIDKGVAWELQALLLKASVHGPERLGPACAALVESHARGSRGRQDVHWLEWMGLRGLEPSATLYSTVFDHQISSGDAAGASRVLELAAGAGAALGAGAYNAVLRLSARAGGPAQAVRWFERMAEDGVAPDAHSCSEVVAAWSRAGDAAEAAAWLERLLEAGLILDRFSYTSVISSYAQRGDSARAAHWLQRMLADGLTPDEASYNAVINSCAKRGDTANATAWLDRMRPAGLTPNTISYTAVIDAFSRKGNVAEAVQWHGRMSSAGVTPNSVSYNAVIGGYARQGDTEGASAWLERMRRAGLAPDGASCNALISSCARRGDLPAAARWLERMPGLRVRPDAVSYHALLHACARAGSPGQAKRWLARMAGAGVGPPGVVAWSARLAACARAGPAGRGEAESAFVEMLGRGVRPDRYTLAALDRALGRGRRGELCQALGVDAEGAAGRGAQGSRARQRLQPCRDGR